LIHVDGLGVIGEHLAARLGDCRGHVAVTEVDGPDEPVGRSREQKCGGTATVEGSIHGPLGDQALGQEILHALPGRGARQPG
jgi:hypothetical protein